MPTSIPLISNGATDIRAEVADDGQSFTLMTGGDRLLSQLYSGGHVETKAHMAPGGGVFEADETGHLLVTAG